VHQVATDALDHLDVTLLVFQADLDDQERRDHLVNQEIKAVQDAKVFLATSLVVMRSKETKEKQVNEVSLAVLDPMELPVFKESPVIWDTTVEMERSEKKALLELTQLERKEDLENPVTMANAATEDIQVTQARQEDQEGQVDPEERELMVRTL